MGPEMGPALFPPDLPRVTMTLDTTDDNLSNSSQSDAQSGAFLSPNVQFANLHEEEEPADERNPLYLDQDISGRSDSPIAAFMSPNVQFTSLHEEEQPSELFMSNPLYRELVTEVRHHNIRYQLFYSIVLGTSYLHYLLITPFPQMYVGNGTRD